MVGPPSEVQYDSQDDKPNNRDHFDRSSNQGEQGKGTATTLKETYANINSASPYAPAQCFSVTLLSQTRKQLTGTHEIDPQGYKQAYSDPDGIVDFCRWLPEVYEYSGCAQFGCVDGNEYNCLS